MEKPITLCDRCDNYMRCLLDYDGKPCRKTRTIEPTNADRIRAMTDEELAEALCLIAGGLGPVSSSDGRDWLEWLKEEVK